MRPGRARVDHSFGILAADGSVAGILPLRATPSRIARAIQTCELDSLGGPALLPELGRRTLGDARRLLVRQLEDLARALRATEARLTPTAMAPAFREDEAAALSALITLGGEPIVSQRWALRLGGDPEEAWNRMQGRARTAVRKATKAGVSVREAGPEDLDPYYALHQGTYDRNAQRPHPRKYFELIWDRFLASDRALALIAELDGEPIAAQTFAVYKGASAYWTGASDERGLSTGANNLLQWEALKRLTDRGVDWYEAGEAFPAARDPKLRGLSDFKRSTGGELKPLYRLKFDTAQGALDVAVRARDFARSVRRIRRGSGDTGSVA